MASRAADIRAEPGALAALEAAMAAPRIAIERLSPVVDDGRFPARAVVGQPVTFQADLFLEGHEKLDAAVLWRDGAGATGRLPMRAQGNDRYQAEWTPTATGTVHFRVEAWHDRWSGYVHELGKKVEAGLAVPLELEEGRLLLTAVAKQAAGESAGAVRQLAARVAALEPGAAAALLLEPATAALVRDSQERAFLARSPEHAIRVERRAAGFASWYELFPRSQSPEPGRHGTFDDVIARLPAIRAMGFDVLYFPPIHPIGRSARKGRNNSLRAQPGDPGSPYAIGSAEGGHDAVHPELGGIEAFRRLRAATEAHGLELALDLAVQFSPDHPWLKEHPRWFPRRPDGSLRHAENPPKKYEDIVNVDFYAGHQRAALWLALRDVVLHWVGEGVRIFRVDNPHTKPLPFWQWLIAEVQAREPDVLFLSEAFTRPAMMYRLAKLGFSQSYTYFTWRNTKAELTQYLTELTTQAPKDFFRPHFFVNTPDINPVFLHQSGRPGFLIRAALAATLSGLWGLYSGFELCEGTPLPGKEEYLDSEKYELKSRQWLAPGNIVAEISRLNHIRRDNPALQTHHGVVFLNAWNEQVLYFAKRTPDRSSYLLVAVSLDPHHVQETQFEIPLWEFGLPDGGALEVEELMRKLRFTWRGKVQHWRFVPAELPFAIWRVRAAAEA